MRADLSFLGFRDSLDSIVEAAIQSGVDPDHASYVCQSICNGDDTGVIVDEFGRRVHTIATRTAKAIRGCFQINGKQAWEIDVANAQPLLLSILMNQPTNNILLASRVFAKSTSTPPRQRPTNMLCEYWMSGIQKGEARQFSSLCQNGELYETLMAATGINDRSRVKKGLFRDVLFGKLDARGPVQHAFAHLWPSIYHAIMRAKEKHGYKTIAQGLQRLESRIIVDGVCGQLVREHPGIQFLTVHDSILFAKENAGIAGRLIASEFAKYGIRCTVTGTER